MNKYYQKSDGVIWLIDAQNIVSKETNKLIEEINKPNMTFNEGEKPKIVTAFFKNDAGIIGATIDN